jgi:hypothetical protein
MLMGEQVTAKVGPSTWLLAKCAGNFAQDDTSSWYRRIMVISGLRLRLGIDGCRPPPGSAQHSPFRSYDELIGDIEGYVVALISGKRSRAASTFTTYPEPIFTASSITSED